MKRIIGISAALLLSGCAASSVNVKSLVLPTSNKTIDVVQHRSSVEFLDCGTLIVLQTYSAEGALIDSKEARGEALHCGAINAGIQSGGMVGAAAVLRPSRTNVDNSNANAANAEQSQLQGQSAVSSSVSAATAASASNASSSSTAVGQGGNGGQGGLGGKGGAGGKGGSSKPSTHETKAHGNNGKGNGGNDGSPNGKEDSDR
jgi:hypothetical protein